MRWWPVSADATAAGKLLDLLEVEQLDADSFRGPAERNPPRRLYGGQVMAQALMAAGRTVREDRLAHSFHAYFVRPGDPAVPVVYRVDRLGDGRSFATRRVTAVQRDLVVFTLTASFHRTETGLSHQHPMPDAPAPESLPTYEERIAAAFDQPVMPLPQPFEQRFVGPLSFDAALDPSLRVNGNLVWLRFGADMAGRGHLLHACLLAYISDISMLDTVAILHGVSWADGSASAASLDHAMWFHRPFRADEWLLYAQDTPVAHGGRGFTRGQVFTRDGRLVASASQEGVIRVRDRLTDGARR